MMHSRFFVSLTLLVSFTLFASENDGKAWKQSSLEEQWAILQPRKPVANLKKSDVTDSMLKMLGSPEFVSAHPEVIDFAATVGYQNFLPQVYVSTKDEKIKDKLATLFISQPRDYLLLGLKELETERDELPGPQKYRAMALLHDFQIPNKSDPIQSIEEILAKSPPEINPRDQLALLSLALYRNGSVFSLPEALLEKTARKIGELKGRPGTRLDDPIRWLDGIVGGKSDAAKQKILTAFRQGFINSNRQRQAACPMACTLAESLGKWAKDKQIEQARNQDIPGWDYGNRTLIFLFLMKASRQCPGIASILRNMDADPSVASGDSKPKAEEKPTDFVKDLREAGVSVPANVEASLRQLDINREQAAPQSPLHFGNLFFDQYLKEMENRSIFSNLKTKFAPIKKKLENFVEPIAQLQEPTPVAGQSHDSIGFYYLKAIASIHHPENESLAKQLQTILDTTGDPLLIPYDHHWLARLKANGLPEGEAKEEALDEAAPRAPTVNYALYLSNPPSAKTGKPLEKKERLENVILSLENFQRRGWISSLQSDARPYHSEKLAEASAAHGAHLYYPNVAYAVSIANKLLESDLSGDQEKRIENALHGPEGILPQLQERVNVEGWVEGGALENSTPWKNAFTGLAFLAECKDKRGHSLGLLSDPTAEAVGTWRKVPSANEHSTR